LKSRKKWIVVVAMAGALATMLLLAGIVGGIVYYGATSASAQEPGSATTELGDDWRWGWFGWGCGSWTVFDTVAEALGLTPNELFIELHDEGKTLSEVAEEQGVDTETLWDALSANRTEAMRQRIQQAVEDGDLSQEEADWLLQGLDKGFMGGRRGGMMGFGGGFGRGHGFGRGF
jgi:hypothetical protein